MSEKLKLRLPKKLIVCCDGTWENSDNGWVEAKDGKPGYLSNPTNVTRIARAIKEEDSEQHPQIVYYQAGIGTGIGLYDKYIGGGTGKGLAENIREAYAFLAANYFQDLNNPEVHDSITIIGFSRGAFTARSIGGFVAAVGILTKEAVPYFTEVFMDWERSGDPEYTRPTFFDAYAKQWRLDHSEDGAPFPLNEEKLRCLYRLAREADINKGVDTIDKYMAEYFNCLTTLKVTHNANIHAIGVFETVGALGIPVNPWLSRIFGLPAFFKTYGWYDTRASPKVQNAFHALGLDEHRSPFSPTLWEKEPGSQTNLKQCWFPGAHAGVGGSYDDYGTANISLAWMLDQLSGGLRGVKDAVYNDWIEFDDDVIKTFFLRNEDYYKQAPKEVNPARTVYSGWSMGKVYNSNTFPESLAGPRVRTPGRYHKTNFITGRYEPGLLHDTHETVHSSVRARIELGGRGIEWDDASLLSRLLDGTTPTKYDPQYVAKHWWQLKGALVEWERTGDDVVSLKSHDTGAGPAPVEWHDHSHDVPDDAVKVMKEDVFVEGGYEHWLLQHWHPEGRFVEFRKGENWLWTELPSEVAKACGDGK